MLITSLWQTTCNCGNFGNCKCKVNASVVQSREILEIKWKNSDLQDCRQHEWGCSLYPTLWQVTVLPWCSFLFPVGRRITQFMWEPPVRWYTANFRAYLSHLGCSVTFCAQVDHGESSCNTPRRKENVLAFGGFIQLFVKVQSEAVGWHWERLHWYSLKQMSVRERWMTASSLLLKNTKLLMGDCLHPLRYSVRVSL